MKKINKIAEHRRFRLVLVLAVSLFALAGGAFGERALAQDALSVFTYSVAVPTGDLESFADEFSWRGWTFDYRFFLRDQLSLGFGIGWQNFSDLVSDSFTQGTVTATGTTVRYTSGFPVMGTAYWYLGEAGGIQPYAGGQVGFYYVTKRLDFGIYSFWEDYFQFGLVPELGVLIPVSRLNLIASVRYNYAFQTDNTDAFSHVSFNIGFAPGSR
jgi:hypothetical protein